VQAQAAGIIYTATFATQYELTVTASPSNEGSVSGGGQFDTAGSTVTVTATPAATNTSRNFSADLTGTANPQSLPMNGPKNVTANFGVVYACSVSNGTSATVADGQAVINEAPGKASSSNDVKADGIVNLIDLQIVINAAIGKGCTI
jgi:hypothetical protein